MCRLLLLVAAFVAGTAVACAQGARLSLAPTELYPGENRITLSLESGIQEIRVATTAPVKVERWGGLVGCPTEHELDVTVNATSGAVQLWITVIDCNGRRYLDSMTLNAQWVIDRIHFGNVEEGVTICREFSVRSLERDTRLDSLSSPTPGVTIISPDTLPILIPRGRAYNYRVCFAATTPGSYVFPVVTWMLRDQPSGGHVLYAVADTGTITVVPKRRPPPEPTPKRDTATIPLVPTPPPVDPTSFRSIVTPNALMLRRGAIYAGSYDLLGLTGGYAITDNLMLIAGGALPTPDDWTGLHGVAFGGWSFGLKGGINLDTLWSVALGYQYGESRYDREETPDELDSKIRVNAPWGAVSYGTPRRRLSLTGGYAYKRHVTIGETFDRDAFFLIAGGDIEVGRGWKVAAEVATMGTLGYIPVGATLRWFTNRFALDAGLIWTGIATGDEPSELPVLPVLSGMMVW